MSIIETVTLFFSQYIAFLSIPIASIIENLKLTLIELAREINNQQSKLQAVIVKK